MRHITTCNRCTPILTATNTNTAQSLQTEGQRINTYLNNKDKPPYKKNVTEHTKIEDAKNKAQSSTVQPNTQGHEGTQRAELAKKATSLSKTNPPSQTL